MKTREIPAPVDRRPVIGLPGGLLFYRYKTLWQSFFSALGCQTLESGPTTQRTAERGAELTVDEACLSLKLYFGHVAALVGRCDLIFVPRICGFGRNRELCPRFSALYDMAENLFRGSGQRFLTCSVDGINYRPEEDAMIGLGRELGATAKQARTAWRQALREDARVRHAALQRQNALWEQEGLKILLAAHSYILDDAFIGRPILSFLQKSGAIPLRADLVERETARKRSVELSPTCKWELSREILGGLAQYRARADGVVLISTFPCGPDAMVNELLLRRLAPLPVLNLVVDGQSGTAGLETRLESFLDIIRFKKGTLL